MDRASVPRFRREGPAPRVSLTEDDDAILLRVFRHRFIRTSDLYRLFPNRSADRLSRRLAQLYRAGFLDRPLAQIDYFHEGGSQPLVYGLDTAGARYLNTRHGIAVGPGDWKSRNRKYTRDNLDHTLATTRFLIDMELSANATAAISYIPPETVSPAGPAKWSVPLRVATTSAGIHIVPDAVFGLRKQAPSGPAAAYLFLEIDRGSMTVVPARAVQEHEAFLYRATILRKFMAYAESVRLDLHRTYLGIPTPRVLFLTTSQARADTMRAAASAYIRRGLSMPPGLFLFGVQGEDPAAVTMPWRDMDGNEVRLVASD